MKFASFKRLSPRRHLSGDAARRASTTMADQCVASASNFAVGVIVARISGAAGLGAFTLAYTCWILVTTIGRSLITDPMTIFGDMRHEDPQRRAEVIRRGVAAEFVLGVVVACLIALLGVLFLTLGQPSFAAGMLAVAPWIIFLDLQDYWRWIGFMRGEPKKSLRNDVLFNIVQALAFAAIFLVGLHTVYAVVSAWGLGAAVAALYGFFQFSVWPTVHGGVALLRLRWSTSRWLASERAASWGGTQLYLIVAGAMLGPAALGGLKASQALVAGPATVVVNAGGSFGLPEASRHLAEHGWPGLARVSRLVTGAGVLAAAVFGAAVLVAAPALLRLLYGPEFVSYATCARIFAVATVINALQVGPILTLTTTRRVRSLFAVQVGKLILSVAAVWFMANAYGVNGAAASNLLTALVALVAMLVIQARVRSSIEKASGSSSPAPWVTALRRLARGGTLAVEDGPPVADVESDGRVA